MNWLKNSRQRLAAVVAILLLALMLAACGTPVNASSTGGSSSPATQQRTHQTRPASSNGAGIQGADQQVQSLLRQLDGAQNDVNNADAGASQDNGQP